MLKQNLPIRNLAEPAAAAFRRLCVETIKINDGCFVSFQPPSGGCVLKRQAKKQK